MTVLPPPAGTSGKATTAMVLGIVGLVGGFMLVPLLAAVLGNVFASLATQDIDASGGRLGGRGHATAGFVCSTVALVVWVTVFLVVAATRGVG